MTKKEDEDFENSNKCWIYDNVYVDSGAKVRDHCRIIGKYRGSESLMSRLNEMIKFLLHFTT